MAELQPRGIREDRMARKYFGTDGIRGRANAGLLTPRRR